MKGFRVLFSALRFPIYYTFIQIVVTQVAVSIYLNNWASKIATSEADLMDLARRFLDESSVYLLAVSAVLILGLMVLFFRKWPDGLMGYVGVRFPGATPTALLLLGGLGAFVFISFLLGLLPIPAETMEEHDAVVSALGSASPVVVFLISCLLVPACEEMIFRGVSQRALMRNLSLRASICMSAVIFAVFHFNPVQTFYALLLGFALGMVYAWYKSIWACILMHVAFNTSNLFIPNLLPEQTTVGQAVLWMLLGLITVIVSLRQLYRISPMRKDSVKSSS